MATKQTPAPTPPKVAIEFEAELRQIKTMADGTANVTLNLPEYSMPQAQEMMGWLLGRVRVVAILVEDKEGNGYGEAN